MKSLTTPPNLANSPCLSNFFSISSILFLSASSASFFILSASAYSSSIVGPPFAPFAGAFTGASSFFAAGAGALPFFLGSTGA